MAGSTSSRRPHLDLRNESYLIRMRFASGGERYFKDARGWVKVSTRGRRFRATAEQVLNHLLPALAGVKRGVSVTVLHRPRPARTNAVRHR